MNVVVLDGDVSYPPTSGKRLRTLSLMLPLARRHRLTYLARGGARTAEVARRRPGWARAAALLARIEEAEGRIGQALAGYLRAVALGDRRPAALGRAAQLLAEQGRRAEGDEVLR